jgi:DNA-binding FadR family transcriptional regulator
MAAEGPVYLRWRTGRPAPVEERFETTDDALDAIEARWTSLQHQAPQLLDARRILMLSTAELAAAVAEGLAEEPAGDRS